MRTVKILSVEQNPLTTIGGVAGICYGQTNPKRFPNIAKRCLAEDHGRVLEFTNVTLEIDGVSAKVGRELLRHIHMSSLQASTRYIDYSNGGQFAYITPPSIKTDEQKAIWDNTMKDIQEAMVKLKELEVPVEDFTNLLPLAYSTKIVVQINLRSLIHMFHVRACTTAYHEFRTLMRDIKKQLSEVSEEWKFLADNYLVPKCVASGYCTEKMRHCGIRPLKEDIIKD